MLSATGAAAAAAAAYCVRQFWATPFWFVLDPKTYVRAYTT